MEARRGWVLLAGITVAGGLLAILLSPRPSGRPVTPAALYLSNWSRTPTSRPCPMPPAGLTEMSIIDYGVSQSSTADVLSRMIRPPDVDGFLRGQVIGRGVGHPTFEIRQLLPLGASTPRPTPLALPGGYIYVRC